MSYDNEQFCPSAQRNAAKDVETLAEMLAEAKAEGVNDGIRLAAQLVRDHVLGDNGRRVADFLVSRAERGPLNVGGGGTE